MLLLWFLYLSLQHGACTQEARCRVSATGNCIQQVLGEIKGKFFEEKRPFTIYYNQPNVKQEIAAFFSFIGLYHCQAAKGFNCDDENINNTFSITVNPDVPCKAGTFTFSAEGEEPIICNPTQMKSEPAETNQSEKTENNIRCENDTSENDNRTVVTIFVTFITVAVGEAALFVFILLLRRRRKIRRSGKMIEQQHQQQLLLLQQQPFETSEDESESEWLLERHVKHMTGEKIDCCL